MVTLESVQNSLRIAADWQQKGQPSWVSKCLSSALMGYLQLAVTQQSDPVQGASWLASQNVADVLQRHLAVLETLGAEVTAGRLPSSVIAGNYHSLVFAHVAWLLGNIDLGQSFVAFAGRPDVCELSTPFWREYVRGLTALIHAESYQPAEIALKGQEKYWMSYLHWIAAASHGQNTGAAVAEVDRQFAIRNNDKKIKDDAYGIEGSGAGPVRWDFRRASLLAYLAQRP